MSVSRPSGGGRRPHEAGPPGAGDEYVAGVMRMEVEGRDSDRFLGYVKAATAALDRAITAALGVRVELLAFEGPHLTPAAGTYAPLDFPWLALAEPCEG